jgi:hypothetical protein
MHNQIWVSFLVGLLSTGNLSCAIHLLFGIPTGLLLSCVCSNRPQTFGKCTKSSKLKGRASFTSTTALWGWRTSTKRVNPRLPSPGPACKPHPAHSIKSMQGDNEYMRFSNHRNLQLTRIQTKVVLHQVCTDTNDTQISDCWQLLVNRFAYQPGWKMRDKAKVQAMAELTPCAPVCFWISLASVIAT